MEAKKENLAKKRTILRPNKMKNYVVSRIAFHPISNMPIPIFLHTHS